ncbi:HI1506-related protein [Hafnia paralvei]|uniref:HI1506-related protein n=1 Tax=Hafnia paralvei TaxID=546367 RepID=UPI001CF31E2F|nr:HI1506-related protein [Hafnia paralvei]MCQ4171737.1 HI1506-related protein [Hafnia paralvei]
MPIQITAKRDGFRRCGMPHSEKTKTYPDGYFTQTQLDELKAENMLIVVEVSDTQQDGNGTELQTALARIVELESGLSQLADDNQHLKAELDNAQALIAEQLSSIKEGQDVIASMTVERGELMAQLAAADAAKSGKK